MLPADFNDAVAKFDRTLLAPVLSQYAQQMGEMEKRFPVSSWESMPLRKYALGHAESEDSFCRWCEFKTTVVGSIRGGASQKLIIFKRKSRPGWHFPTQFTDEESAWKELRAGFVRSIELAREGKWEEIESLLQMQYGPALGTKMLHFYFPQEVLSVFSGQHLRHFLGKLGKEANADNTLALNRKLLATLRSHPALTTWSTKELERLLYQWADPRESRRVLKIAPGEDAKFWDECLAGGFICVGWDGVGDLSLFESKDEYKEEFRKQFTYSTRSKASAKANELWSLRELEPGDLVVANKGTSAVLGVGEVVEPGYVWREDREEFRHTVAVKWDTSFAKVIPPQPGWATVTVAKVSPQLEQLLLARSAHVNPVVDQKPVADETLNRIAKSIERRKQAILYGPPGTGKTYHARRFAVWWLLKRQGRPDAARVLVDSAMFETEERRLATPSGGGRVWWIVANPGEWNWDELFKSGAVDFRQGRLQRNYHQVKKGDWVLGYQSTPAKRLVAVARVVRELSSVGGREPNIGIEAVAKLSNGLSFDEIASDPVLSVSEPIRFGNRGTLFALNEQEAGVAVSLLRERNPGLKCWEEIEAASGNRLGLLTRVSFHGSYAYEDFIEGFRPVDSGQAGIALRLEDGIFKRVCLAAAANPDRDYLVLVDEINRANVAKVMGELLTLLEADKRGLSVTLPQSKESFSIPKNVFLLGTMNTADRSIKLLDTALRRRFAFLEMMPNVQLFAGAAVADLALDDFLLGLNQAIERIEGREKQVGHSYFLREDGRPVSSIEEFGVRFREELLPLLQEYSYDESKVLLEILGPQLVDPTTGLKVDVIEDDAELVAALASRFAVGPDA